MKLNLKTITALVVVVLLVIGGVVYTKAIKAVLPDDQGAKLTKFENLRAQRYTEMFLIGGNGITKDLKGGVYNTVGLNDPSGTGDTSPDVMLDRVDIAALAKQYNMLAAFKNGPRLWTLDWLEVNLGVERDFNGMKARWVTWLDVPKGVDLHEQGGASYKDITVHRNTQFGFNTGTEVYLLDDPDGNTWIMKSASLIFDKTQTYDDLKNLGTKLKPPEGWKFRTVTLTQDLVLTPDNGTAHITQDDIGNTYDRTGGPYSNYKP